MTTTCRSPFRIRHGWETETMFFSIRKREADRGRCVQPQLDSGCIVSEQRCLSSGFKCKWLSDTHRERTCVAIDADCQTKKRRAGSITCYWISVGRNLVTPIPTTWISLYSHGNQYNHAIFKQRESLPRSWPTVLAQGISVRGARS